MKIDEPAASDPFDLSKLRVNQDFLAITNVKKLLTTVPVRKPGPQDFVRVHPSPAYRELFAFLELKEDSEVFLVDLQNVPELQNEVFAATLFTAITRTGTLFLWPVHLSRRSCVAGHEEVGPSPREYELAGLRNLSRRECHSRTGMARADICRTIPHRFQGSAD